MNGSNAALAGDPADVFLAHLERIDRIIDSICRRNAVRGDEADDLRSWVHARLIDDDYAVFRKFGGRSSIGTYLTVVIANLYRDYRIRQWGKWRPSAEARRLGPLAVQLERLLHRDGCSLQEAIQRIRSAGTQLPGDADIARMAARLPLRDARGPDAPLPAGMPANEQADDSLRAKETRQARQQIEAVIDVALSELPAEDVVILKLRFWEGLTVAAIARSLTLDQKSLYPRIQKLLIALREELESRGIESGQVADLLAEP